MTPLDETLQVTAGAPAIPIRLGPWVAERDARVPCFGYGCRPDTIEDDVGGSGIAQDLTDG